MDVKVKAKHIRVSPRKVRLVADAIRGLEVQKALDKLKFINKKVTKPLAKLLGSAIANAEHNHEIEKNNLKITEIRVDDGPTLKRWMPRAHGRATTIRKRTSHVVLTLSEIEESSKTTTKKQKIKAPVKLGATKPKSDKSVKVEDKKKASKKPAESEEEKDTALVDPRGEGRGKHTKLEGKGRKGFSSKMFRRKSG